MNLQVDCKARHAFVGRLCIQHPVFESIAQAPMLSASAVGVDLLGVPFAFIEFVIHPTFIHLHNQYIINTIEIL